ncbi:MAG TPA: DUF1592 domain-containing protein [Steroidobacteraceae bacterium]|nr:DUF1592 domain-containing protein [Steroidobacteraceae bacterium]
MLCAILAAGISMHASSKDGPSGSPYVHQGQQDWGMLKQYCSKCHNTTDWAGGVAFDTMDPAGVPANAEVWEAAVRKLSGDLMPPPGNPHPPGKQVDGFVSWLRQYLDAADAAGAEPLAGHVAVQRLNRTQYGDEVQALLGVTINVADLLPPETEVGGFDNIAAALTVSPSFLSQYVRAARVISHLAVGEATPPVSTTLFPASRSDQDEYQAGMPLGSRGGETFTYNFPVDGEYRFTLTDLDVGLYTWATETRNTVVLLVDGKEVFRGDLGGLQDLELADREGAAGAAKIMARFANIPVHIEAGQRKVAVTFVQRSEAESDFDVGSRALSGRMRTARLLGGVKVSGPFGSTHLSETPSRRKIFICQPQAPDQDRECALKITEHLARLAFHRPVTQADMNQLMSFYDTGVRQAGFNRGIEEMVAAVLASPSFLYRAILPTLDANDGKLHALSSLELASRLSFFLWNQGPDEQLLDLATTGRLTDPKILDAQVVRMLADPRAESLVDDFAFHWLDLDKLDSVVPEAALFPGYSPELRDEFRQEAKLFISSIFLGNQSVIGLLNANYTFLNDRLARHYGIDSVYGSQFRRVDLKDHPERWGLLGKAAMLMETSYADRTSPVRRGAWILDKLMGTPPAQPPPGINMNLDQPPGLKPTTVRTRLEQHRASPSCSQCHGVIDPYGLALENFNATGQWRSFDNVAKEAIDPASALPNGAKLNGVNDLRRLLLSRPDQFVTALTEKLMMYCLGRKIAYYDMPQVRAIVSAAKHNDYRFSAIVLGIVDSPDFHMQAEPDAAKAAGIKVAANAARSN